MHYAVASGWNHFTITTKRGLIELYINGVSSANHKNSKVNWDRSIQNWNWTGHGYLSTIQMWHRFLSTEETRLLYFQDSQSSYNYYQDQEKNTPLANSKGRVLNVDRNYTGLISYNATKNQIVPYTLNGIVNKNATVRDFNQGLDWGQNRDTKKVYFACWSNTLFSFNSIRFYNSIQQLVVPPILLIV